MIKNIFGLLLLGSILSAKVTNTPVTIAFVEENKMKIIDIRTEGEWVKMGIIRDAYLLTFFDEQYHFNAPKFLKELDQIVEKDEQFAIICNTASRTQQVSNFLSKKHDYNVVNLTGGMMKLYRDGFQPEFYDPTVKRKIKKKSIQLFSKSLALTSTISFISSSENTNNERNSTGSIKE